MSSLWTPGGEVPVNSDPDPATTPPADPDPNLDDAIAAALPDGVRLDDLSPEQRAQAEEMVQEMAAARERLLSAPASTVVANHAMGLYELAALHLSQPIPNFNQASVAIDAMGAIVDALPGRLDEAEPTLREGLDQIRMTFVKLKNPATTLKTAATIQETNVDGK